MIKRLLIAPLLVALTALPSSAAVSVTTATAASSSATCAVTMPQPVPSPLALYGRPGDKTASPISWPSDNYYSGALTRPGNLDCWYGNGYNW